MVDLISERSYGAGGRLEQPITYWNAEGLLAGIGLLLCARLAGDRSRPAPMRAAAAAACAPLGAGVYLSYSRGALAVTVLGLIVLLAAAPTWPQLRAAVIGSGRRRRPRPPARPAFPGVASLTGTQPSSARDGAIMLALLLVDHGARRAADAALDQRPSAAARPGSAGCRTPAACPPSRSRPPRSAWPAWWPAGSAENARGGESAAPTASRFASVSSVRYEYWRVGALAFTREPVHGLGAGGFRVFWREERRVPHSVTEVHSLPLEMAAELGLPGLLLFVAFVGGIAVGRPAAPCARARRWRPGRPRSASAWLLHATIDWDWQLPAVTLPAHRARGRAAGREREAPAGGAGRLAGGSAARAGSP